MKSDESILTAGEFSILIHDAESLVDATLFAMNLVLVIVNGVASPPKYIQPFLTVFDSKIESEMVPLIPVFWPTVVIKEEYP